MGISLEVGRAYKTRNGGTVIIEHEDGDDRYPFFGKIVNMDGLSDRIAYFTAAGRYNLSGVSVFDIQATG